MRKTPTVLTAIGISIVAFAVTTGWILLPFIIDSKIKQEVCLKQGGETYQRWKFIPVPIYMKVYLFNVTNPEEIVKGEKPILKEVGPYVYSEKREKLVEKINVEEDTIFFRPKITYFFRRDLSIGDEEDVLTFINVPLVSTINGHKAMSNMGVYVIVELMLERKEKLFIQKKVGDFLFKGYHDGMVAYLSDLSQKEFLPNNTFSMYGVKNGTTEDLLEIYSGVKNSENFGTTISWNGQTELTTYENKYCNMINGSDGSLFPPFVTRDRVLKIFSPDMCRSMYMTYKEDAQILGINGYRFTTPKEVVEDPRINPENACYCAASKENVSGCLGRGIFEMSVCRKGASIAASWPHFYEGDPVYLNQSIGLSPNRDIHETFIVLEPHTGSLLRASKRFQLNIVLSSNKKFPLFKKVPNMLFPILWVDESAGVDDNTAGILKEKLITPLQMASIGTWSLFGLGMGFIIAAISFIIVYSKRKPEKA